MGCSPDICAWCVIMVISACFQVHLLGCSPLYDYVVTIMSARQQVFFIRDGIKFPDMVHALKPNPKNHIQEDWRIADFFSHIPEAMHMVCYPLLQCDSLFL